MTPTTGTQPLSLHAFIRADELPSASLALEVLVDDRPAKSELGRHSVVIPFVLVG